MTNARAHADGIVHVKAKDKATNKDQSMTIASSSGLNDKDIEQMVADAERYAESDKARRSVIEEANKAESVCADTEKALEEFKDQLEDAGEREKVRALVGELRELAGRALKSEGAEGVEAEAIKEKIAETQKASLGLFQKVYEKRAKEAQPTEGESTEGAKEEGEKKEEKKD